MTRLLAFRFASLITLCLLGFVSGCGPSGGTVSGKVTYRGKPVTMGHVTMIGSDNVQYVGDITSEGTYSIPHVPGGPVKITVSSPNPNIAQRARAIGPGPRGGAGDLEEAAPPPPTAPTGWVEIPPEFADPEQSGLTGTVKSATIINLDLE